MASKRPLEPVLHCPVEDFHGLSILGHRIVRKGIYKNKSVFQAPPLTKTLFLKDLFQLDKDIKDAVDSISKKAERSFSARKVHYNIKNILDYVKPICNHNPVIINLTGLYLNRQPQNAPIPEQPIITKITKGAEMDTYKVYLKRRVYKDGEAKSPKTHQKNNTFVVEITLTPEIESSWYAVLSGKKMNSLILTKYTLYVVNYIRIYGKNASGKGQRSMVHSFIPQC